MRKKLLSVLFTLITSVLIIFLIKTKEFSGVSFVIGCGYVEILDLILGSDE